jgi:hypothetical protein
VRFHPARQTWQAGSCKLPAVRRSHLLLNIDPAIRTTGRVPKNPDGNRNPGPHLHRRDDLIFISPDFLTSKLAFSSFRHFVSCAEKSFYRMTIYAMILFDSSLKNESASTSDILLSPAFCVYLQ